MFVILNVFWYLLQVHSEHVDSRGNIYILYSGSAWFKCWLGHCMFWHTFVWASVRIGPLSCHDILHPILFCFIIHQSFYHLSLYSVPDTIIKGCIIQINKQLHIYIHKCMHAYTHTHTHIYIYTYICMYIQTYIHAYIYTYICIYVHNTYIHTYKYV